MDSGLKAKITFDHLLKIRDLRTLFQPIVTFRENEVKTFGLEALTRGPKGGPFESAGELFDTAEKRGELYRLEKVSRKLAIERFSKLGDHKLFLNLDPNIIYDESFAPGNTLAYLDQAGVSKDKIIFEITERNKVKDRDAFEEAVEHYRNQGYRIAVDDVGSGYANLDKIASLEPDYIKIDMSIIRNLHVNRSRYKLVETIIDFGKRIGSDVVGEGIENREELQTLLSMGIDHAQGFFIAKPSDCPRPLNETVSSIYQRYIETDDNKSTEPILDELTTQVETFTPDTLTRTIYDYLKKHSNEPSVVITRNDKPTGYLSRDQLHRKLSTKIKQSLYWDRAVKRIMDDEPLILPGNASVTKASKFVTERHHQDFYNEILVVDSNNGKFRGTVSIKRLLKTITEFKTQKARRANPLTGLPGNIDIRDYIKRQLDHDREFALIYSDLDHFKPFNDYYGFERGDEAIILLKNVLKDAMKLYPSSINFLGHVGGDDFVATTTADHAEDFCKYAIDQFDERIRALYDNEDINRGYIKTTNRNNEIQRFNLMTVSLAVVTNTDRNFKSHLEMSEVAAEMKKYVKRNRSSSSYEIDRRSGTNV